jgi:hypothetical protein
MRKETINPQTSHWSLERIPPAPANVKGPAPNYGVTLTEIEFGKDKPVSDTPTSP